MLALYIHWPFCLSKCPYCDFNSYPTPPDDPGFWIDAYKRELAFYAQKLPKRIIRSIFFGGGTPSLMSPQTIEALLDHVAALWPVANDAEISLEANPSSADASKFQAFRHAGINRLSLGVQALHDEALTFLGRRHNAAEAKTAMGLAARIFPRFSFDMIYAYRGQTRDGWERDLNEIITLAEDHLSLYQLTIEPRTIFWKRAEHGETLTLPDDEAFALFERTQEIAVKAGIPAYEISNHARKGAECRHNMVYWRYEDYLGIGPGAHSRLGIFEKNVRSIENIASPALWRESVLRDGSGADLNDALKESDAMREALLMGLRLTEGIAIEAWDKKFSTPLLSFLPSDRVKRLEQEGFLVSDEKKSLRATLAGRQRLNALLSYLV
ncbi:MAG: radical SAM family heme chaperone HemW [Alphaproteobacteria bacterium]|nr:radical SAM family heme chaperone HemW [Alphaproteobacteria bacterium]